MFGLMKTGGCGTTRQLHYCGTCKSMGRLFSQKSRLLLNHDAVFLGELLTAIGPRQELDKIVSVKHCTQLPKEQDIPWALRYAAVSNLVLAYFKCVDHIADTGSLGARIAKRAYSTEFAAARQQMREWEFPIDQLEADLQGQVERESHPNPTLASLSEPTVMASRSIFAFGATKATVSTETVRTMRNLGAVFGEIAYLADAIEDRDHDLRTGSFNALTATSTNLDQARDILSEHRTTMISYLEELPLSEDERGNFASRLRASLRPYLSTPALPIQSNTITHRDPDTGQPVRQDQGNGKAKGIWEKSCCDAPCAPEFCECCCQALCCLGCGLPC